MPSCPINTPMLTEQSEAVRIMFDAAPIGLTIFGDSLAPLDCNKAALEMFGVTKEYYLGNFYDLSPEYQPDGLKSCEKFSGVMKRTLNGEQLAMEWMHRLPAGEMIPSEITTARVRYNDMVIGLAYVYDLRRVKQLDHDIILQETESERVYVDPLTGIHNRRFFDIDLNIIMKTLSRSGGTLSMMMVDIDFFNKYNDRYGRSAGDDCLKTVAGILLKSVTREDDFVVRYGGEEFAVVLPNTDEPGVRMVAEKMLENVQACNIPHDKSGAAGIVTVSIGVTTGKVMPGHRADDFILRADELLYKSKQGGRNRYTYGEF